MKNFPGIIEFDERTSTITIRHARTGAIQIMFKLESGMESTMTRINPNEDCDNFWIALKPADSTVFEEVLFDKKKLHVKEFEFELS